jgi:hypothetical protein
MTTFQIAQGAGDLKPQFIDVAQHYQGGRRVVGERKGCRHEFSPV